MPFYLYKSNRKDKKFVMVMPEYKHLHNFGSKTMRDYTLINDKNSKFYIPEASEREKVKKAYRARHRKDNIDDVHSSGALSWHILWSEPTLKGGIKAYSKRFGVVVVDRSDQVYYNKNKTN